MREGASIPRQAVGGQTMGWELSWWQAGICLGIGAACGALLTFLVLARLAGRKLEAVNEDWELRLSKEAENAKRLGGENDSLRVSLADEQASLSKFKHAALARSTELHTLQEKVSAQSDQLTSVAAERDALGERLQLIHRSFVGARHRVSELESEFGKSREFYKAQIMTAVEQRQSLEQKMEDAQSEQSSLEDRLSAAESEHQSVSRMLTTAQSRLDSLESLEAKLIELEADNAQLKHDVEAANQQLTSVERGSEEAESLREQNQELAQNLESMAESRKQYEEDAVRYRAQYDKAEDESETLRVRLEDIQQRLADMEEQHEEARHTVGDATSGAAPANGEGDDLTEIVGVGKVFEAMLHRLGIFYFRQIAAFGSAELARVNAELNEFKGRIEHDDWIGQAKKLHFKKYGAAPEYDRPAQRSKH